MPAHALALVLAAALLHALWNLAAKRWGGGRHFVFACALGVVLWVGLDELPRWSLRAWTIVAASAAVHLAYFNCLIAGYRASDLTVVYPVARGSGPLLSALAAVVLLDEHLGIHGALGLAGVVGGILLSSPWARAARHTTPKPRAAAASASTGARPPAR